MPEEIKGHCVKCKAERVIENVEITEAEITRFLDKQPVRQRVVLWDGLVL